ncbi:MAG: type II toxin-antitoxin system Phd/YefM family antitoxin [Clostridia bacterium]|nr:type II toxin-antitoxin system Phd/YefM family antitoxin [Clostridia bacterium]
MPQIRPISDLRNNFAEISKIVHEGREPVFLTKNGYGDMVVMSIELYEKMQLENEIFIKLKEAELEARTSDVRYGHAEVFGKARKQLANGKEV